MPSGNRIGLAALVACNLACCLLVTSGCAARTKPQTAPPRKVSVQGTAVQAPSSPAPSGAVPSARITNTDPCANQLHDICGGLLLYYATNNRLPEALEELRSLPLPVAETRFDCPVSGKPYVYVPTAAPAGPAPGTWIVVYDALPSHEGKHWAISVNEPAPGEALIAKVITISPLKLFPR